MKNNEQLVAHAKNIHRRGDIAGARKIYLEVLDQDPKNYEALTFMGVAAQQEHNLVEARGYLEQAYSLKPDSPMVEANYANTLFLLKEYDRAQKLYEKLLAAQPSNPTFLSNYGSILLDYDRQQEALAYIDRAIAVDPNNPEILAARAKIKANLGLLEGAIRDTKRMLSLPKYSKEIEKGATHIIQHCVAMNTISTFHLSKRIKTPYTPKESAKIRKEKNLDIVTFFIPPNENWYEIKRTSHKTSWDFFLKSFYARAKALAPKARVILLTSQNALLPSDLPQYEVIRLDVAPDVLMYSRLTCQLHYMSIRPENTASFVLDMDVLINQIPLDLVNSDVDVALTTRQFMPPVNAGVMFLNSGEGALKYLELTRAVYDKLVKLAPTIPELADHDFKKWWGDQIAMCGAAGILHSKMLTPTQYQLGETSFKLLDCEEYNYSPKAINNAFLEQDFSGNYFLHIKGSVDEEEMRILDKLLLKLNKK